MIDKEITYNQQDVEYPLIDLFDEDGLEKTASMNYDSDIVKFLTGLEKKDNIIYALVNALSAGEYYSSNRNGDYFPEKALKEYHPTFVDNGYVYLHHKNKDPKKSIGDILYSTYNDKMKRVELVISVDIRKPGAEQVVDKVRAGNNILVSMACKVPEDICSITGKRQRNRSEYSDYAKNQMGKILPDGRKVYVINEKPKFFDISIVTVPADPTARVMAMVNEGCVKTASYDRQAAMNKEVTNSSEVKMSDDPKELILKSQEKLSPEKIEELSKMPLNEVLSTLMALRILPTREDFQDLVLKSRGHEKTANYLRANGIVFESYPYKYVVPDNVNENHLNEKVANLFKDDLHKYSLLKPFIIERVVNKQAAIEDGPDTDDRSTVKKLFFDRPNPAEPRAQSSSIKNPMLPMLTLGTLYAGYAKLFGDTSKTGFTRFINKNKALWLPPILAAGVAKGSTMIQENYVENNQNWSDPVSMDKQANKVERFLLNSAIATPLSYYGSMKAEEKVRQGQPVSNTEDLIRKHPLVTSFLGGVGGTALQTSMMKSWKRFKQGMPKLASINNYDHHLIDDLYEFVINGNDH